MAGQASYEPKNGRNFQPRVEAEEGDPKRGDFVIAVVVALLVIAGVLWALGIVNLG